MKIIYFGSSEFSRLVLESVVNRGLSVSLAVSREDKPAGRGLKVKSTEVSRFCRNRNIPVLKPSDLSDVFDRISGEESDFFVVADYGKIIPGAILALPKKFPLGVHPSLLPSYRGSSPIERALLNGDKFSGVTIFKMNERVDAGDIASQKKVAISAGDDFFSLRDRLAREGADLLCSSLKDIEGGKIVFVPQNENKASYAFKFKKSDAKINWKNKAEDINNLIRATIKWPGAYTFYKSKRIKVIKASIGGAKGENHPSVIVKLDKNGIGVATSDKLLQIELVKPEGKKEMDAWSFACGRNIEAGDSFD
ncbi:MAG: methionyl-tRNA formyltransferase [Candidatus Omnitrophica bacterium]|nr:methionyl-tRNA formyltransferase [Candidatus Omnitrophota bacterium]MBD3269847.1 methionyl-tRNA formyltransferase [Candidatus Omnitrophota bacterium]